MTNPFKIILHKYGWVHLSLGLFGNAAFFIGSLFFLPALDDLKMLGVWLFVVGSGFMLIGALGRLLVDFVEPD
jgi:hypothetical protein